MRNTMIAAATALVLSVGFAAPSFADDNNYGNRNPSGSYAQNQQYDDDDYDRGDRRGDNGTWRRDRDDRNFDRHERRFDQWERGWRDDFGPQYGRHKPLSYRQLVRRLEFQGYYGVRNLRKSHWGGAWRAFAYSGRGRPVMLRINPYTGRVLAARPLWS
ncbi:MAG: hypothetical protein JNL06_06910 [Alphaproteobacteria bacterium]|nr:hypothetical protein [Alphaproteobacteria bacterium]